MIIDSMSKYEVMSSLRKEFDEEILPFYKKVVFPKLNNVLAPRCKREKKTINLGWLEKPSKNLTLFKILQRGTINGPEPLFVSEFRWNNKLCYGNFFQEGNVVVYQAHCLERYAERVLQRKMPTDQVFYKHILKCQDEAFHIVLPTPSHPFSYYYGMANALFLGDYDNEHLDDNFLWCNTCISYNETRYSQLRITKSLLLIQDFVRKVKYDFCNIENEQYLQKYLKQYENDDEKMQELKDFFIRKYLLWKLHLSFNFDFTEHFRSEVDENISYIERQLKEFNIIPQSLSPYSKNHGIAWRGEIDYRIQ